MGSRIGAILAYNLKQLRAERGWTAEDLAALVDMSPTTIRKIETNAQGFSRESIATFAKAFGVPEARLFFDPDSIPEVTPQKAIEVLATALDSKDARIRELQASANSWNHLPAEMRASLDALASIDNPEARLELFTLIIEIVDRFLAAHDISAGSTDGKAKRTGA